MGGAAPRAAPLHWRRQSAGTPTAAHGQRPHLLSREAVGQTLSGSTGPARFGRRSRVRSIPLTQLAYFFTCGTNPFKTKPSRSRSRRR
jgi:hypothetical protein